MTTEGLMLAGNILALLLIAWAALDLRKFISETRFDLELIKEKLAYSETLLHKIEKGKP